MRCVKPGEKVLAVTEEPGAGAGHQPEDASARRPLCIVLTGCVGEYAGLAPPAGVRDQAAAKVKEETTFCGSERRREEIAGLG